MNYFIKAWSYVVYVFEKMDIVPPIIAVSVVHYAGALQRKDPLIVALIIGFLVDIGHYRSVKAFIRKNELKRFILMLVLTVLTGYYHYLWYGNLAMTLAIPLLIISLATMSMWDGWEKQAVKIGTFDVNSTKDVEKVSWRNLSLENKKRIINMTTREVMQEFGQDERTACNWVKWAKKL